MLKINCSDLPEANRCMLRFFANTQTKEVEKIGYTLRKPQAKSAKLVLSSCCNEVINKMFRQKIETGRIDINTANNDAVDSYRSQENTAGEIEYDRDITNREHAIQAIQKVVARFKYDFAGEFVFPPKAVYNDMVNVEITGSLLDDDIELSAKIPLIDSENVYVFKYSKRYSHSYHAQLGGYRILLQSDGDLKKYKTLNTPISAKTGMQKPVEFYDYGKGDDIYWIAKSTINRIAHYWSALKEQKIDVTEMPANPACVRCSQKYCKAWGTDFCVYHRWEK